MKHLISALVENKPGVLAHVAGMFAARAFNIDSLVVGRTEDPKLSRMTIVVVGDDRVVEQVRKQLARIVPVVKVQDFAGQPVVARDLMLVSVSAPPEKRPEIVSLVEMFRGKVVDIGSKTLMVCDAPAGKGRALSLFLVDAAGGPACNPVWSACINFLPVYSPLI